MTDTLRIVPLGGLGEIGLNMLLVEYGDSAVAIDCGVMFPEPSMLGIDLVVPDVSYLRERPERLQGIVLTHGHEDHIGALPFVGRELKVPTYATGFAHALIEQKLAEHQLALPLERFKAGDVWRVGPFEIEAVHITHSIVDAVALAITTPLGTIIHTGDFKFDQTPIDGQCSDLARLAEWGERGVLLLLSDSTNVERPGATPSERTVTQPLENLIAHASGKVLVATFASHIHRIRQIIDLSRAQGRMVGVVGKSLIGNLEIARETGHLKLPADALLDVTKVSDR